MALICDPEVIRQLLALADLMEAWAAALPRWERQGAEPWHDFLDRAFEAETGLAARLRRLPSCELRMCPQRRDVSLALGGLRVSTAEGLAAACRAWAKAARARAGS